MKKQSLPDSEAETPALIETIVICDQVRQESNGKLFFIGVYSDVINVARLPLPLQLTFVIQARMTGSGSFAFSVSVTDPLGNKLADGIAGKGSYAGEPGRTVWLPVPLPLVLSAEGEYVAAIDLEGAPGRHERFQVRKMSPLPPQIVTSKPN